MQLGNRTVDAFRRQVGRLSGAAIRFALLTLAGLMIVAIAACRGGSDGRVIKTDIPFRPDGILDFTRADSSVVVRLAIEVAESDSAQARGLMDRRSLPARGGMLFINPTPSQREFWMRNTPLPLDIIFIRSDHTIANIVKRTTPYSDDRIRSEGLAQYVLEVRAGFTDLYGLTDSLRVEWKIQP